MAKKKIFKDADEALDDLLSPYASEPADAGFRKDTPEETDEDDIPSGDTIEADTDVSAGNAEDTPEADSDAELKEAGEADNDSREAEDEKPAGKTAEADSKDWKKEFELAEKRRRDSQSEYSKELQKRKDLEDRLKRLEEKSSKADEEQSRKKSTFNVQEFESRFRSKLEDGDTRAVYDMGLTLLNKMNEERPAPVKIDAAALTELLKDEQARNQLLSIVEEDRLSHEKEIVQAKYEDYEETMKLFIPAVESDEALREKWLKRGKTVQAAYDLGQELIEVREIMQDPEKWKAQQLETLKSQLEKSPGRHKSGGVPKTLASANGKNGVAAADKKYRTPDQALASIGIL